VHERAADRPDAAGASGEDDPARFTAEPGTLYVVATPLGNLRDLTLRALDILASADVIAAEDTRVTALLLRHYGIAARAVALHEHNEAARAAQLIDALRANRSVALVSDAGTPAISDPGARLVRAVGDAGLRVVPIPGPSAVTAALSAAGMLATRFLFVGFLPASAKARRDAIAAVAALPCALVIYEAPHRVAATVEALADALGGERELTIARELTKKFETIARMPVAQGERWLAADANRTRGEFVLIVDAPPEQGRRDHADAPSPEALRWLDALSTELPPARAARVVAAMTGEARDALYARALANKRATE
jgi:16S rRNA (cytidine1402-2'-O)-methyltransferase